MRTTPHLMLLAACALTISCADSEEEAVVPVEPFNAALQQDACGVILPTRFTSTSDSAPTEAQSLATVDCNALPLDECRSEPTCEVWGGYLNSPDGDHYPVACIARREEPQLCAGAVTGHMDACGRCWVQHVLCIPPPGSAPSRMPSCSPYD